MTTTHGRPLWPTRLGLALCLLGLLWPVAGESRSTSFRVRNRSAQAVYLEGGASAGLAVGDRLEILRQGDVIAEIEVAFVAGYSSSCRVVSETEPIATGDLARLKGVAEEMLASIGEPGAAASVSPQTSNAPQAIEPTYQSSLPAPRPPTRISGTIALEYESFTDDGDSDLGYDRTQARLNFRGKDLGGLPLYLRVRSRVQEIARSRALSGGVPADESRDRLYEVSLRYDAPSGRYSLMGGRIGAAPFISIGYLDGVLAEVKTFGTMKVGGFWGNRPDISELGFESSGTKYGGYMRFANDRSSSGQHFDVMLGGVREEGEVDVSREYALIETYYDSGGAWSFFQRAEIDVNNDWREELSDDTSQLSNLAVSARGRLSETVRLVVSYDQFRQYRTEETRFIPAELFDDLLRQGFRVAVNVGRPRQLNWSVSAGWRAQEDAEDDSISFGLGARHPDVGGLSIGGDVLAYSNLYTEGGVARLRTSKFFRKGHELYLDLGGRFEEGKLLGDETADAWGRVGFWADLPARFFARGEFEYSAGDSIEGSRVTLGLGYRF